MKKQEYIKKYVENLKRKLNEITDAYYMVDYTECEFCPLSKDGKSCINIGMSFSSCIEMLDASIDNISEVE